MKDTPISMTDPQEGGLTFPASGSAGTSGGAPEVKSSYAGTSSQGFGWLSSVPKQLGVSFIYMDTLAAILADTDLTYEYAPEGTTIGSNDGNFYVAAPSAENASFTTVNGLKLFHAGPVFPNVAEMVKCPIIERYAGVATSGYARGGDGGGGMFDIRGDAPGPVDQATVHPLDVGLFAVARHELSRPAAFFGFLQENSGAQNDIAMGRAIEWLNRTKRATVTVPAGVFSSDEQYPALTGSDIALIGAGRDLTVLDRPATSQSGEFFEVGNGLLPSEGGNARVHISGFQFRVNADEGVYGFCVSTNGGDSFTVEDIRVVNVAGLIRVGELTKSSKNKFSHWYGSYNSDLNQRVCTLRSWTNLKMDDLHVYGSGENLMTVPTFDFNVRGLCDTLYMDRCEIFSRAGSKQAILADISLGAMVNVWINDCVFDKHGYQAEALLLRSTASSTADPETQPWRAQNWWVSRCRFDTGGDNKGGKSVRILSTSSTGAFIRGIHFQDNMFTYRDGPAFETVQFGDDRISEISVVGGRAAEAAEIQIDTVFQIGHSGFLLSGVTNGFSEFDEISQTDTFVTFTRDWITDYIVTGNMVRAASELMVHAGADEAGLEARLVSDNTVTMS